MEYITIQILLMMILSSLVKTKLVYVFIISPSIYTGLANISIFLYPKYFSFWSSW